MIARILRKLLSKMDYNIGTTKSSKDVRELINKIRPQNTNIELLRIGGNGDGGYLLPDDLNGVDMCYSPGVSNICTFEDAMSKRNIISHMADFSVDGPPKNNEDFKFIKKFLGSANNEEYITLKDWMDQTDGTQSDDLILQMDIEGAEYRVLLDTHAEYLKKFRIMVIEFHQVHRVIDTIGFELIDTTFDKLLRDFHIVHIHPNNCANIVNFKGVQIPPVIEVTFHRKNRVKCCTPATAFPHKLDEACVQDQPDITLPSFWYK